MQGFGRIPRCSAPLDSGFRRDDEASSSIGQRRDFGLTEPILKVEDAVCAFGGLLAVDNCSFEVEAGTITGLIGPNGAGKSTMFNLITDMVPLQSGRIFFDGRRLDGIPPHSVARRGVARTFQIPGELGRMTALENLALVPEGQLGEAMFTSLFAPGVVRRQEERVREQAREVLGLLQLTHLEDELAANLSTGQKKLLEIGRALMASPKLVLLDEPAAGVNPTLMREIAATIRQLRDDRGITWVIVEHDVPLIMDLSDRVIVMAEGRVIADGTPEEVRGDKRVLDAYLGGVEA